MQQKKFILLHVIPFALALITACVFYSILPLQKIFFPFDAPSQLSAIPDTSVRVYGNCNAGYTTELNLRSALTHGNPIVLMGSSELGRPDLPAIPYNFFRSRVQFPCVGLGHAGNQSFSIAMLLAALHDDYSSAKLVISISPGWFFGRYAGGTSLESFLEFVNERFLYYVWFDKNTPADLKDKLGEYVEKHYKEIDSPSSILRLIYYSRRGNKNSIARSFNLPFTVLHSAYTEFKAGAMDKLYDRNLSELPFRKRNFAENDLYFQQFPASFPEPHWDSLMHKALEHFKAISNNNSLGVENNYYNSYLKGRKDLKRIDTVSLANNAEYRDFLLLLSVLKHYRCSPLFIIQPLNPFTHDDLSKLRPVIASLESKLKKNNFDYLNMFVYDRGSYIKGTLADVMHLGDYGWYIADKKIYEHFLKPK